MKFWQLNPQPNLSYEPIHTLNLHTSQHILRKKKSLTWCYNPSIDQCVTLNKVCPEEIQWDQQPDYKQSVSPPFPLLSSYITVAFTNINGMEKTHSYASVCHSNYKRIVFLLLLFVCLFVCFKGWVFERKIWDPYDLWAPRTIHKICTYKSQ